MTQSGVSILHLALSSCLDYLEHAHKKIHLNDFLKYKCELYLKQPFTPPQRNIIVAYCTSNYRLAIEIGWWTITPISSDTRLCHVCFYDTFENEAQFMLKCPLYNPIRDKFPSVFENVFPKCPGSLFFSLKPTS